MQLSEYDGGTGTAKLLFNKLSQTKEMVSRCYNGGGTDIVIQTAGNRSMLANDYTQVNDLGYGLLCNNAALSRTSI